ncbi:MAG: enoyl-CoA hydratase/isomerase family protein [Deltaproteobacteria bacterium]|nr:enoyl-CoA hydratase/isomerase family protein [Deltaproteobacteria bacterium]
MMDAENSRPNMTHVVTERKGAVGIITLARPERFNGLDVTMARDLRKAALGYARDDAIRCVVLAGGEKAFCSGADLKYVRQLGAEEDLSYLQTDAVKGVAAAGGFGLAMSCDLVFAAESAGFEWAYPKTGLTGAESSTFFLTRLIGLRRAFGLVFLNPRLSAREALDVGLINGVFPVEKFDAEVFGIAERLGTGPTRAYGITKRLINEASGIERLDTHMDKELKNLVEIAEGEDFSEGLEAFFAKQTAQFKGNG